MKHFLTISILLLAFTAWTQNSLPKDYFNKTIQEKQRMTATYFWTFLELNMPDSALNYIDTEYLGKNPSIKDKVYAAAKTISPIHKSCIPKGNGSITYTDTTNVVSVYYTIPPTPKYAMWLSFRQGDENSKIVLVDFKNEQRLAADRRKHEKNDSSKPSKTPPPTIK